MQDHVSMLSQQYQNYMDHAKQHHGERFNDVFLAYQNATKSYVECNASCQGEIDEEQRAHLHQVYHDWLSAQDTLFANNKNNQ